MFDTNKHINFGESINNGYAEVFMNMNGHTAIIKFIYKVENDEWIFMYENGTFLLDEERVALENWFITCG